MELHLNLKRKYFDLHLNGKDEEYRSISKHWIQRFMRIRGKKITNEIFTRMFKTGESLSERLYWLILKDTLTFENYDIVIYSNGMKPVDILPRFSKKVKWISIGKGKKEWGAPDELVFIIKHTEPFNIKNV